MTEAAGTKHETPPVAVIGVSALFAGSPNAAAFWRHIVAGSDLTQEVPATHWLSSDYFDKDPRAPDKTYCNRGSFLPPTPFDPVAYGVPPTALPATDTSQLLALVVAQQVLQDAYRGPFAAVDKSRMSVILGVTACQELYLQAASRLQRPNWVKGLREAGLTEAQVQAACDRIAATYTPFQEATFPGALGNVVAGRIANRFDLRGTNCVVDAACASSLAALAMALQELHLGHSDVVLTGGVDTFNDISMYVCFSKTPALSATGDCRPFAEAGDGTVLGEGLAMFALKRLPDAERDGDHIYGVIRGLGTASDGRGLSIYAPSSEGQAECLRRAYERAGCSPASVGLIEAHGTGTKAGDLAEFRGLEQAFRRAGDQRLQGCALGSVKSQIGHTKAAAGAAGMFKALMALHHKVLPPTIKVDEPSRKLDLAQSPFYLNTQARPWVQASHEPRRAGVSSFGFGGTNFHLVLEEYRGTAPMPPRLRAATSELFLLGGQTRQQLLEQGAALIDSPARPDFAALARHTQTLFIAEAAPVRLAIVAKDQADLAHKWQRAAAALRQDGAWRDVGSGVYYGEGHASGALALLFPGQGSQYVGMGKDLALGFSAAREVWDRAAAGGLALHERVFPPAALQPGQRQEQAAALTATQWAQPALAATSVAALKLLQLTQLRFDAVAGHSFGELTALHAAGVFSEEALLGLARCRGELMAAAAADHGAGGMLVAAADAAAVTDATAGLAVSVANDNSPRQVVLAGSSDALEQAAHRLRQQQIAAKRLPVAAAFHSPLVATAAPAFGVALSAAPMQAPRVPVYANTTGQRYPGDELLIRQQLASQLARPVQFRTMIEAMYAAGVRTFVEVGAGNVLTALVGQNLSGRPHLAVAIDQRDQDGWHGLWTALAQLAVAGYAFNTAALWQEYTAASVTATAAKPAFTVPLIGSNYGKPYPPANGAAGLPAPREERAPAALATSDANGAAALAASDANGAAALAASDANGAAASAALAARDANGAAALAARDANGAAATAALATSDANGAAASAALAASDANGAAALAARDASGATAPAAPRGSLPAAAFGTGKVASVRTTAARPAAGALAAAASATAGAAAVAAGGRAEVGRVHRQPWADQSDHSPHAYTGAARNTSRAPRRRYSPSGVAMDSYEQIADPFVFFQQTLASSHATYLQAVEQSLTQAHLAYLQTMESSMQTWLAAHDQRSAPRPATLTRAATPQADQLASGHRPPTRGELNPNFSAAKLNAAAAPATSSSMTRGNDAKPASAPRAGATAHNAADTAVAPLKAAPTPPAYATPAILAAAPTAQALSAATMPALAKESAATLAPVPAAAVDQEPAAPAPAAGADVHAVMLAVVAEKTGYPVDMLNIDMALEADLGVDSIKRVEILAALQEQLPALARVDPAELAVLHTLGEIGRLLSAQTAPMGREKKNL